MANNLPKPLCHPGGSRDPWAAETWAGIAFLSTHPNVVLWSPAQPHLHGDGDVVGLSDRECVEAAAGEIGREG